MPAKSLIIEDDRISKKNCTVKPKHALSLYKFGLFLSKMSNDKCDLRTATLMTNAGPI